MLFAKKQNTELDKFAELLEGGLTALFHERGEVDFSGKPQKNRRQIMESEGKMCADGMEKFNNEPTYVSAINFYTSKTDMEKKKTLGTIIIYVQQEYIAKLMKLLQYPPIDDESDDAMQDSCGTLCNIIAGRFKSEIASAGYIELEMSHFVSFRNTAFTGIAFCESEYDMYEIIFSIADKKRMVVEMTMGTVLKR